MTAFGNVHDIDEAVTQHIGEGRTYATIDEHIEFRAKFDQPKDLVLVFLPGRSTQRIMVRHLERIAVWRKWLSTKSFAPTDYNDVSKNPAFLLSVLKQITG